MDSLRTTIFIAYKSIVRGRKGTTVLMLLILSLSFFNMMFIHGVFSGLLSTITGLLKSTSTSDIVVTAQQIPVPKAFVQNAALVQAQLRTIPGVVGTARTYLTAGSISYDKDKNGVFKTVSAQVIGIDPSSVDDALSLKKFLVAGQFLSDSDSDQLLLPAALAGGYGLPVPSDLGGVKVGDKVNVVFANGIARTYTVKGIVSITFGTALSNTYISAREAESVLSASDQATQILVKADTSLHPLTYYKNRVEAMEPTLRVQTYEDLLAFIQPVLNAFTLIATIVAAISVFVATVTLFVMIYINAVNRRRQIGILKAIGIKESIIVYSYVIQALFYVLCGVFIGLMIVYFVVQPLLQIFPIHLPFGALQLTFGKKLALEGVAAFMIAGFFAGLIPARIVARENIIKAIWG